MLHAHTLTPTTAVLTAHDFPSAHAASHAGIDMILVGDSLAMVALGQPTTSEITLPTMTLLARAVAAGAPTPFLVGDLPMGSYEVSNEQAVTSAITMVKEGRVESVKLEGGRPMASRVRAIVDAGVPVLAHVGLTPQRQSALGGFRVQGKTAAAAEDVLRDALAVQDAGAWGVVLEAVPQGVADVVTRKLRIPTIGIGAGNRTSGQVLVQVDMSGNFPPGRHLPKFVKRYGDVWAEVSRAMEAYRDEVKARSYPAPEHTYDMKDEELARFEQIASEMQS